jgi:hypothetical protein
LETGSSSNISGTSFVAGRVMCKVDSVAVVTMPGLAAMWRIFDA